MILSQLPQDPSEEDVRRIALELAVQRASRDVRRVISDRDAARLVQERQQAMRHYTFWPPYPKEDKIVQNYNGERVHTHPRTEVKVLLPDFAAFCKERGLNEKAMREVAAGQRESYKSWEQGITRGPGCANGPTWNDTLVKRERERVATESHKADGPSTREVRIGASPAVSAGKPREYKPSDLSRFAPIEVRV